MAMNSINFNESATLLRPLAATTSTVLLIDLHAIMGEGREEVSEQPKRRLFSLRGWQPTLGGAFRSILVARMISAFCMHISDCDETFNYWEPVRQCA